jgi:hypothetical protein
MVELMVTKRIGAGKAAGGNVRAAKMTPAERSAAASKAAKAKVDNKALPKATHGSADTPLVLGEVKIPCYVLADGTRLLSHRGLTTGFGISHGSSRTGDNRLVQFIDSDSVRPFAPAELIATLRSPIKFLPPHGGKSASGYPATVLADICEAVLQARRAGALTQAQQTIAAQAEILVRGFARVGIIALVDEATGYQKDRAKDALAKILEAFVARELQPYVSTFPADYYEQLFRLRGLPFPPEVSTFRPQYFGILTNDIIYKRIAPGLLAEIKRLNEKDEKKGKLFQRLTPDVGRQKLRDHITAVVMAMKLSRDYQDFIEKLNSVMPRYGDTYSLDLEEQDRGH